MIKQFLVALFACWTPLCAFSLTLGEARYLASELASATLWNELEKSKELSNYSALKEIYDKKFSPLEYLISHEQGLSPEALNSAYEDAILAAAIMKDSALELAILTRWKQCPDRNNFHIKLFENGYRKRKISFENTLFQWILPDNGKVNKKELLNRYDILREEECHDLSSTFGRLHHTCNENGLCNEVQHHQGLKTITTLYLRDRDSGLTHKLFEFEQVDGGQRLFVLPSSDGKKLALLHEGINKLGVKIVNERFGGVECAVPYLISEDVLELYVVDLQSPKVQTKHDVLQKWDDSFLKKNNFKRFSWPNSAQTPIVGFAPSNRVFE